MNLANQLKDPSVAAILSFVITGAGNIYNGRVGKGIVLTIAAIIGWFLIIPGIVIWIWGVFDAYKEAQAINADFERHSKNQERQIAEEKQTIERTTTNGVDIIDKLSKLHRLHVAGMLAENEFLAQKSAVIGELATKKLLGDSTDFLARLIPLRESGGVSEEEVQKIKKLVLS